MFTLKQALQDHHLIVLRILGEWYELDLIGQDKSASAEALSKALLAVDLQEELIYLQPEEADAMRELARAGGRMSVSRFRRSFGTVREMGAGKLEREEPWLQPTSAAEALWYRGFIFRAFDESDEGMIEYFYIPTDLLANLDFLEPAEPTAAVAKRLSGETVEPFENLREIPNAYVAEPTPEVVVSAEIPPTPKPVEPAPEPPATKEKAAKPKAKKTKKVAPKDLPPLAGLSPIVDEVVELPPLHPPAPASFTPASDLAVDDVTTLLALAARQPLADTSSDTLAKWMRVHDPARLSLLLHLALAGNLLRKSDEGLRPTRAALDWLQQKRNAQAHVLYTTWLDCEWNALRAMPSIVCEGAWPNPPAAPRKTVVATLPESDEWISAETLIANIKTETPDFQRPDGDYDTWYIRDAANEQAGYLSGFETWDRVEGRVLHYVIFRPMFWLGLVDTSDDKLFRLSARMQAYRNNRTPQAHEVDVPIVLNPDASMTAPQQANRFQRFQLTRIAEPQPLVGDRPYQFKLTPESLNAAREQGIKPDRVISFLEGLTPAGKLPAGTRRAIERWSQNGSEAHLESFVVLRVGDPNVIATLRSNPKTRDLLGESLGELAVVVRQEHVEALRQVTAQLGLLLDKRFD